MMLTPKLSEWRFYDIGAKFSLVESKCLDPFSILSQPLYLTHFARKTVGSRKKDFLQANLGILPKNQIQAAVKILNDGGIL